MVLRRLAVYLTCAVLATLTMHVVSYVIRGWPVVVTLGHWFSIGLVSLVASFVFSALTGRKAIVACAFVSAVFTVATSMLWRLVNGFPFYWDSSLYWALTYSALYFGVSGYLAATLSEYLLSGSTKLRKKTVPRKSVKGSRMDL